MKHLSLKLEKLEQRVAPGGLSLPGVSLPVTTTGGNNGGCGCEGSEGSNGTGESHKSK
jgi:hypothetical protein